MKNASTEPCLVNTRAAKTYRINIVTGKGGGGHYATYHAIRAVLAAREVAEKTSSAPVSYRFQITDMDDIMAQMTQTKESINLYKWLGSSVSDIYNSMLKRGWTWLWPVQMRLNKLLVKLNSDFAVDYFKQYWQQQQPDIVVSVVTMCNKVLWKALDETLPGTPYVTVMIDFADEPPGFWIEPDTDSYIVCGKQRAVEQANSLGVNPERIVATSGMVIHPRFRQSRDPVEPLRADFGLAEHCLTGLVMFGGNGADVMMDIAQKLSVFGDRLQLIFLCGHNLPLKAALQALPGRQRRLVVGFTAEVPDYMHLADFFIGKPGPGSLSEALAMNLPVITERNFSTLIHERYNATWIEQEQMGIVLRSFAQIERAVETFLDPEIFEQYRQRAIAHSNDAVEEVADLIQALLSQTASGKAKTRPVAEVVSTDESQALAEPVR